MIMFFSSLLNGCGGNPSDEGTLHSSAVKLIEMVKKVQKTAEMKVDVEQKDQAVIAHISISNPEKKPITSVQSWLSYNPDFLKGVRIETSNSPFGLVAPYDNTFDEVNGVVMIGRSNGEPIMDEVIPVVDVIFQIQKEGVNMLDAYDYQYDLSGHTSVNTMVDGKPYNILKKPDSPIAVVQ